MFVSGRPLPYFPSFSMMKPIICFSRESQAQLLEQNLVWLGCFWCLILSCDCQVPWEVRGGYFWCLVFLVWDPVSVWVFQYESSHHHNCHHHHPVRSILFRIKAELCCAQADPLMAMVGSGVRRGECWGKGSDLPAVAVGGTMWSLGHLWPVQPGVLDAWGTFWNTYLGHHWHF